MPFLKPMLASPMPEGFSIRPGEWAVETKFDGHRLLVEVSAGVQGQAGLFTDGKTVRAWSRHGLPRILPVHLMEALGQFPEGLYDGELLVPGLRSFGVTELTNSPALVFTVFDLLELLGHSLVAKPYDERRSYLAEMFNREHIQKLSKAVQLAQSQNVETMIMVRSICQAVWDADGEGLILKRRKSPYCSGKRSKDFIKMKQLRSAVLEVVGFAPGKGLIVDRGPYAMVLLRDAEGQETSVKTLNDKELYRFQVDAAASELGHPAIGRKLRIEYQERTTDGSYRHPRWDRWENE